ncbi:MAG: DUF2851 family protein [Marinifilaceae bacterium]
MTEDFIQYLWRNGLYRHNGFISRLGHNVEVLNVGVWNKDAGPDFSNSRIKVDGITMGGHVEIHLHSSDWYKHQHHLNVAYDNVMLSVVICDDMPIYTSKGRVVDTIVFDFAESLYDEYLYMNGCDVMPACHTKLGKMDGEWLTLQLHKLYIERLERKYKEIKSVVDSLNGDWETCFYRLLCRYWGGTVNTDAFIQLANVLPYRMLLKHSGNMLQMEALLFGVSGLLEEAKTDSYVESLMKEWVFLKQKYKLTSLPASTWRFMRTRPDGFPTVRLALLAGFIPSLLHFTNVMFTESNISVIGALVTARASCYWDEHYQFGEKTTEKVKNIGRTLQNLITINVVIPFIFTYGKYNNDTRYEDKALRWIDELKAESNFITKRWSQFGITFRNAQQSQAVVQLHNEYCTKHRCLQCSIGRKLFAISL